MEKIAKFEKVSFNEYQKNDNSLSNYENIKLPKRATVGSAGYDFYAPYDFSIGPNQTVKIPTGIRAKIDNGWFLAIVPRSSLGFKYRLQLDNTVGIIDCDYYNALNEGHIFIKLTNDSKNDLVLNVKKGEAFAQGIFIPFGITTDDEVLEKRTGGFGSTNK